MDRKVSSLSTRSGDSDTRNIFKEIRQWTGKGKKKAIVTTIIILPVIGFMIETSVILSAAVKRLDEASVLDDSVRTSLAVGAILHRLQIERGQTVFYINADRDATERLHVVSNYEKSEAAFEQFYLMSKYPEMSTSVFKMQQDVRAFRLVVMRGGESWKSSLAFYTDVNANLLFWVEERIVLTTNGDIWQSLIAYYFLLLGKENIGILRARGSAALVEGSVSLDDFADFYSTDGNGYSFLSKSAQFSPITSHKIIDEFENSKLQKDLEKLKEKIYQNNGTGSIQDGQSWFDNMTTYINGLLISEKELNANIRDVLNEEVKISRVEIISTAILLIATTIFFPFLVFCIVGMTSTVKQFANNVGEKTINLKRERKKSEKLLYEMLPIPIAQKLLKQEAIEPEHYASATIFFSDIVGFRDISSASTPLQIVDLLNLLYNTFDERIELFEVYKVETIGDSYMIASGLPERNGDNHTSEIALVALDLQETIKEIKMEHLPKLELMLRIGLNTGPVVAGVVGLKMPRYCLFGDTVNTASRMMSMGIPKMIQASATTADALMAHHEGFEVEERGEIQVKGKGAMRTYFLVGKDDEKHPDR